MYSAEEEFRPLSWLVLGMLPLLTLAPLQTGNPGENPSQPVPPSLFPNQIPGTQKTPQTLGKPKAIAPEQAHNSTSPTASLPKFDLDIHINPASGSVKVREKVAWIHPGGAPVNQLIFNAHANFVLPEKQVGAMAKTLEILRMNPADALGVKSSALSLHSLRLMDIQKAPQEANKFTDLPHHFAGSTTTDLVIDLPHPVAPGETVNLELEFTLRLDAKQGRWGQWKEVVYLMQWLPVPAYFHAVHGWQPTPFLPWHQPFCNESGIYNASITLPEGWELACTGTQSDAAINPAHPGWKQIQVRANGPRDFSLATSPRFRILETTAERGENLPPVKVRLAVLPGHEPMGRRMLEHAVNAISSYSRWLGAYPWDEFTLAESYFGWNGNEAGSMVFIDQRVFTLPELAGGFVEYLILHETCHQWWYNAVGTDGFREPFVDEGLATALSHRLLDSIHGREHGMLQLPTGLGWMPNIPRASYRAKGWHTLAKSGGDGPVQQSMEQYGNLAKLFGLAYDKSSKIFDMIADRLGEQAFFEFLRVVQRKYRYRILHMSDIESELNDFTGQDWTPFFDRWLRGPGQCNWAIESVEIIPTHGPRKLLGSKALKDQPVRAVVKLLRTGPTVEDTTLGVRLSGQEGYSLRLPVATDMDWESPDGQAHAHPAGKDRVELVLELPSEPEQISVDPDQIIPDTNLHDNHWCKVPKTRATWLYTGLDESDLTTDNDQLNVTAGPWLYGSSYSNAWYTRTTMLGARAGAYRTQEFSGGIYAAYRTDFRDVVIGADGLVEHWPDPSVQSGFNVEQRVYEFQNGQSNPLRASLFARKVLFPNSSMYLLPFDFLEGYTTYTGNFLPYAREIQAGAQRFNENTVMGLHYRINRLTPYWDPQMGWQFDVAAEGGQTQLETSSGLAKIWSQVAAVTELPDLTPLFALTPRLQDALSPWFGRMARTRLALRAYGGTSAPSRGLFFPLGGSEAFRGYSLAQRQGSTVWVGSAEWRVPVIEHMETDFCDHIAGLRTVQCAFFYDVGDAYAAGHSAGPVSHALGFGLRLDAVLLSFVERATIRLDYAQTIGQDVGPQFWFGITQPF